MKAGLSMKPAFDELKIGARVKTFRKAKSYSLSELSRLTGISEATLSRVENEQTLVSAHNLYVLAAALDVDITAFFEDQARPIRTGVRSVSRKGEGVPVQTARYSAQVLCSDLANKKMHPAINTITVRSLQDAGGYNAHAGEEFLYVVSGKLALHTEFYAPLLMSPGDSIYFDGSMGHAYVNAGDGPAEILVLASTDIPLQPTRDAANSHRGDD